MLWALSLNVCHLTKSIHFTDRHGKCNFVMRLLKDTATHFILFHYEQFLVASRGEFCSTRKKFIIIKSVEKFIF